MYGKIVCLKDEELQGGGQRGQSEQHRRCNPNSRLGELQDKGM